MKTRSHLIKVELKKGSNKQAMFDNVLYLLNVQLYYLSRQ